MVCSGLAPDTYLPRATLVLPPPPPAHSAVQCDRDMAQDAAGAGVPPAQPADDPWGRVDIAAMRENPVDVDFFHLRLRVAADCPFLLGIPLVVLCSRWMKIPDAMFGYLQIATTPVLYVPLVREGRGRLFSVQPPSPRARVGTLRPSSSHTPTRMSPPPAPITWSGCVCVHALAEFQDRPAT